MANLGWTSPVVASIPVEERATLVERLQMRLFQRGEKLVRDREEAKGLHLIMSGEVAIVAREWSERVLLATLGAGETVGEVELVLCRQAYADAIAVRPTAALFLSRDEYSALVQERPAILHGLYATAVRRHAETRLALESGSATIDDDWLLEEEATVTRVVPERAPMPRILAPPPASVAPRASTRPPPPPPQSVYVSNETPPTPSVAPPPSIAPSASSIWPPQAVSFGRRSAARLTVAAGAALVASAAGVLFVLALRYGHPGPPPAAAPAAANPPPAVAPTTTWTVIPPGNEPVTVAPVRSPANKNKLPKPQLRPRIVVSPPANEVTAAVQAASAASAAGSSSATAFAAPATTGPKLSTRASPEVDDFGGRE
jgi:CRP-like cAMP-binding protein